MRAALALLSSAALLAVCAAQQPADCDLSDPDGLSRCIKQLLLNARDKVRWEVDPLSLPDHSSGDLRAWDIIVIGLADYKVDNVYVTFPGKQQIAVRAVISWPEITAALSAEVRKCKRVVFELCASANGRPHLYLGRSVGILTTTLTVGSTHDGQLTVHASGTDVTLNLASLRVKANLRGLVGAVNNVIGDPASKIATELSGKWWRDNKGRVEKKVKDVMDKVVRRSLSVHLGKLLKL